MAAYTGTPRTWAAAEKVTATLLNAEVRDPLAALSGAWTAYTPVLTGFTPGNGTAAGAYMRVNKLVMFRASFTLGTTSAAAAAVPNLSLPVTGAQNPALGPINGMFTDITGYNWEASPVMSTTVVSLYITATASARMEAPSTTSPFTWATGDILYAAGIYEAA